MASILSTSGIGLVSYRNSDMEGSNMSQIGIRRYPLFSTHRIVLHGKRARSLMMVKAEGQSINPEIRKSEDKVVDSVVVTELSKPLTAYCRYSQSHIVSCFI